MRIIHCAPFAPNACGLYEAARDMAIADIIAGHEVFFLDTGSTLTTGEYVPGSQDKEDIRGGSSIITASPDEIWRADIIIAHSGVPDNWVAPTQAPIIWILHGRPAACFGPEQFKRGHSYSFLAQLSRWPRVKKMISFWPHHEQFWSPAIEQGKLVVLQAPPVDEKRFSSDGPKHDFGALGGRWNIMLAESWREDVDIYEITHGAIEFARVSKGNAKFHFYGVETPLTCWEYLFSALRSLGALGEVWARRPNIEEVYRAADILLSPQRIVTRTVGESLSCGTPVIAAIGCELATWVTSVNEPNSVAAMISTATSELDKNPAKVKQRVKSSASVLSLSRYSDVMNEIYNEMKGDS